MNIMDAPPLSMLAARLETNEKGRPHPHVANALAILAFDPMLTGLFGYDEFGEKERILRPPPPLNPGDAPAAGPYPRGIRMSDVIAVLAYMQRAHDMPKLARTVVDDAVRAEAARCRFHPVRQYLAGLRWDGTSRLALLLPKGFGCPADLYHAAAGEKMLIAAVKRIRQPGVKFDHVPVLEGPQGAGKSTGLRKLFGDEWFSDSLPDDLAGKDAAMALNGVWCLEMAELQQLIRAEPAVVKAFLTRQVDHYRPPYERDYISRPRQTILCGSTNESEWLTDTTGNRRFWPLSCAAVDQEWISDHRDQLWAEAAALEAAGTAWWLDSEEPKDGAARAQEARLSDDAWAEKVRQHLAEDGRAETTAARAMDAIGIPVAQQGRAAQMRVAAIIKAAGWVKAQTERGKVWRRPDHLPDHLEERAWNG